MKSNKKGTLVKAVLIGGLLVLGGVSTYFAAIAIADTRDASQFN